MQFTSIQSIPKSGISAQILPKLTLRNWKILTTCLAKVNVFEICVKLWRRSEETNVTQTYHRWESVGGSPNRRRLWVIVWKFLQFFGKSSHFNAIWITIGTCLEPFERTKFLRFESQVKTRLFSLPFAYNSRLKPSIFG